MHTMEKLLHYIWKHRILPLRALLTTDGEEVEIVSPGLANPNAGPDFFNAKVRIGQTMWAGNVEIHLRSSDWYRHRHQEDAAYNNVVLHVAQVVDCDVVTQSGKTLPQLQLDIPDRLRNDYEELLRVDDYPRCHKVVGKIDIFVVHSWMDVLLAERMEERSEAIMQRLGTYNGDWERTLFVTIARNFGFGLNGDAFETWAKRVPLEKLGKHRDELFQMEAVFLGMAGLLGKEDEEVDEYVRRLQREFKYQQRLYSLPQPMDRVAWKYLRLRPQNFPHIRIAQLAWMYHKGRLGMGALLDAMEEEKPLDALLKLLEANTSDYWTTHFTPGKEVKKRRMGLSQATQRLLIINTVVPLLYAYSTTHDDYALREQLYDIMQQLPAEKNYILRQWQACGLDVGTAADSQALIQLKRVYCDRLDCLRCQFGYEYFKHDK